MQYIPENIRKVGYDLTDIKTGESIFSRINNSYYLCIRTEKSWKVYFLIESGNIQYIPEVTPDSYIFPGNEVFSSEKTEWIEKSWVDAMNAQQVLSQFKKKLDSRFKY